MSGLKQALTSVIIIIFGIIIAILIIEISLTIIPTGKWKTLLSKNPARYTLYQVNRNVGWVHVPDGHLNWHGTGEYNVDVRMNSLGLRDYERTYQKPPGTYRILVLGDSFAEGLQVPLEQLFSVKVEKCLNHLLDQKIEVINTGISAYNPGDEMLFFTHIGAKYQPDLVLIIIFTGNDIKEMIRSVDNDNMLLSFGGYQFYLQDGQLEKQWLEWATPDYEISSLEHFLRAYSNLYYIFYSPNSTVSDDSSKMMGLQQPTTSSPPQPDLKTDNLPAYAYDKDLIIYAQDFPHNPIVPPQIRELWTLFKAPFLTLQAGTKAQNSRLGAVIIPKASQVNDAVFDAWIAERRERYGGLQESEWSAYAPPKAITKFLTEQDIPTLDLLPHFQTYNETDDSALYFQQDGHFNQKGHQLTANLICNWLIEAELVQSENLTTD